MKSTVRTAMLALALLGLGTLAYADEHDGGGRQWGGGRWGGEQRQWQGERPDRWRGQGQPPGRGWQQQPPYPPQAYPQPGYRQPAPPQQAYPQQAYPQQAYPQQAYPQQAYPQQRPDRRGPPNGSVQPMPPGPAQPQYAPAPPQWQQPAAPRWNPRSRGFRPGDQLPPEYRQRQFIVNDWRAHRLYRPPPGYMWVQPEPGSYILIGNNGVIANLLVGQ